MTRSRLLGLGATSVLLTAIGLGTPASAAVSPSGPVVSGRTVTISEKVPTTITGKVKGHTVRTRIARPVQLQQLTGSAWKTVASASSSTTGTRTFTFRATESTTLRVVAPRHARTVKLTHKRSSKKVRVTLKAYASSRRAIAVTPHTQMVSRGVDGKAGAGQSGPSAIDDSGRYVVFASRATNLVDGVTDGEQQVYLRDTVAGTTVLVSRGVDGRPGNATSRAADISADGSVVTFESRARNLVSGATATDDDVFVWVRATGKVELISREHLTGGAANDSSLSPTISGDGRYVAFASYATNLTSYHDGSREAHIYRYDRQRAVASRVTWVSSEPVNGTSQYPSINDAGNLVTYESRASNLVPGDTNGVSDIYLSDLDTGRTSRVTRTPTGRPTSGASFTPEISGDGSRIVYQSQADDVVADDDNEVADVFAFDVVLRRNTLVSRSARTGMPANGASYRPSISGDGRVVAFESNATDLVAGADSRGIVAVELATRRATAVSRTASGGRPNASSYLAAVDRTGRRVAFMSSATDLTPVDDARGDDVFVRDMP